MITLWISITILAFAALSTAYKVSQVTRCESWVFLAGLYTIGALSGTIALAGHTRSLQFPLSVWMMGAGAGLVGISSVLCFLRAMKLGGSLSLVNTIMQMSLCVPIIYAVCFLGERLTLMRVIGLALFVVFVMLLNEPAKPAGKEEAQ
jgi:uncharacterized membrane protein